jgi:SAM-dependent methyltransferase
MSRTADHYTKQWGGTADFAGFVEANPDAAKVMPGRQLGWPDLIDRIRDRAATEETSVYDAACGFGDILRRLFADVKPAKLIYVGADIQDGLDRIETPPGATLLQHDITTPLPGDREFDFVLCRAAIHHTPDPPKTFATLAKQLAPKGVIAISAYAKKSPMREAVDDALRAQIVPMDNETAWVTASQFTALGRDLQACDGVIEIAQDLPFLGIEAGSYKVQDFLYRYFIKCWHNPAFPPDKCDLVNFDWYHPPYAFRYEREELDAWATGAGLRVTKRSSIEAQHYFEAVRD